MRRWVVGFELHHQLLLSVYQPVLSAGLGRMTIDEWEVLIGHTADSGDKRGPLTAVASKR